MDGIEKISPLVSTRWLHDNLGQPHIRIIDGSWRLPGGSEQPAIADYHKRHIPGAVFFDIDAIANQQSPLPHMVPSAETFETAMEGFGISPSDHVVIYDDAGLFSAARIWWTYRAMGHQRVSVLDGGLPKWLDEEKPVTASIPKYPPSKYQATPITGLFCLASQVQAALKDQTTILDARPDDRFSGQSPEPRPNLRRGHMPGAVNIPLSYLLNGDKTLKSPTELREIFSKANISFTEPIITTCGSGITAAAINLALFVLGHHNTSLYDGAWAEWGNPKNPEAEFPVAKGANQQVKGSRA